MAMLKCPSCKKTAFGHGKGFEAVRCTACGGDECFHCFPEECSCEVAPDINDFFGSHDYYGVSPASFH